MIRVMLILFLMFNTLMYLPEISASSINHPTYNSKYYSAYSVSEKNRTRYYHQRDNVDSDSLTAKLKPIKANFKRINALKEWTSIVSKDLAETLEGGEANYYYNRGTLEKIVSRNYGETYQVITEYYLLGGQLSFVYEKQLMYNRPMYYDSTAMVENKDTEIFDLKKSTIVEVRSYFDQGKLFHFINYPVKKITNRKKYMLDEQFRIQENFNKMLNLLK